MKIIKVKIKNSKGAAWDSVFFTLVKLITTLTAIVQTKILSVGLSLTAYGTYSQANIIVTLTASVILLGLGDSINYFFNNNSPEIQKNKEKYVNTIFAIEIIVGVLFAAIIAVGRYYISQYFSNSLLISLIVIISIKPLLDNLLTFLQILFVSEGKSRLIAIRNLVISLIKVIVFYVVVKSTKDVAFIFISMILLDVIQIFVFFFMLKADDLRINPFKINTSFIGKILKYSIPMGVFAFTNLLTRDIDRLVIGFFESTEAVAIYTNCSKALPFDIVSTAFVTVLIPYIMKFVSIGDKDNAMIITKNYYKIGYYSTWLFGFGVIACARQVVACLYSPDYLAGINVFYLYVLDSMLKFASMHLILTSSGKTKTLMVLSIFSLIANFILNLLLYKLFGFYGPAIATLIVTCLYSVAILLCSLKTLNAHIREVFDFKDILFTIIVLGLCCILFNFVQRFLRIHGINDFIIMIIILLSYGVTTFIIMRKKIIDSIMQLNKFKI